MLPPTQCPHCGTLLVTDSEATPGKTIICVACHRTYLAASLAEPFPRQGLMRMGDDDGGGGGDWGGGGSDDDAAGDEDEDEEDEEGGKKKKKKKKGFIASLFGGVIAKVISFVIGVVILGSLCCCYFAASWLGLIKPTPGYVGKFESTTKVKFKDKVEDKEVDVEELEARLEVGGEEGTGTFTNEKGDEFKFKVKDHDRDKKTVVFVMDNANDKFWKDLKSPMTFEYDLTGSTLKLTPKDGNPTAEQTLSFTKIEPARAAPPPKKRGKR